MAMRVGALGAVLILAAAFSPGFAGEASWPNLTAPADLVGGGEQDAAVVVGLERYAFVSEIPGAKANAKAWYEYFTETRGIPPENVTLLTDEDGAKEQILEAARRAAGRAGKGGTLWFVFVGHGAPSADGKDGLLVGMDARQTAESLQTRSIRRGELLELLRASRAATVAVVLDACFSGRGQDGAALAPGLQPLVAVVAQAPRDPRMVVLTAAKGDQFAGALPGTNRPAFSYLVLGGLRGWALCGRKGAVTAGALWRYATNALDATLRGRKQEPDLIGSRGTVFGPSAGENCPNLAHLAEETSAGAEEPARKAAPGPGKAGIKWVKIPAGTFMMGSNVKTDETPVHPVSVKAFELAKSPVTFRQYKTCVEAGACTPAHTADGQCLVWNGVSWDRGILPPRFLGDDQPAICVDWGQAVTFASWVGGRIPTEAEWEYAARSAGQDFRYPWGNEPATCERAVIGDGCGRNATWPVCSKPKGNTKQGLCDMAGNVWQWVSDRYHRSYDGAPADGSAWTDPRAYQVLRGGAWINTPDEVRSANRYGYDPGYRIYYPGLRPAR